MFRLYREYSMYLRCAHYCSVSVISIHVNTAPLSFVPSWPYSVIPRKADREGLGSLLGFLVASFAEDWAAHSSIHT